MSGGQGGWRVVEDKVHWHVCKDFVLQLLALAASTVCAKPHALTLWLTCAPCLTLPWDIKKCLLACLCRQGRGVALVSPAYPRTWGFVTDTAHAP